jgi:hypothetical protein
VTISVARRWKAGRVTRQATNELFNFGVSMCTSDKDELVILELCCQRIGGFR